MHGMARRVLNLERLVGRLAVVHEGSDLVHLLVQAAAESHVHFLETAADAEDRNAGVDGGADQRQRGGVAVGVVEGAGLARRSTIMTGLDVRRRASEEQAVDAVQQGCLVDRLAQRRNDQRETASAVDDGTQIFVAGNVVGMKTDLLGAGGDAD